MIKIKNNIMMPALILINIILLILIFLPMEEFPTFTGEAFENKDNWIPVAENWHYISTGQPDEDFAFEHIIKACYSYFETVVGFEVINHMPVVVYIDSTSPSPFIHYGNEDFLAIRLSVERATILNQTIFQLSHEMTHYVLKHQYSTSQNSPSPWNEEILCETMSGVVLQHLEANWPELEIGKTFPKYASYLGQYAKDNVIDLKTDDTLKSEESPITVKQMKSLNDGAGTYRTYHQQEVNFLYALLLPLEQEQIGHVISSFYANLNDNGTIDFEKWTKESPYPPLIEAVSKIQPNIKK